MYGAGACKIVEARLCKPSSAPDPVCLYGVYDSGNDCGVDAVGNKLRPLSHGTGYYGSRSCAEHQVEHEGREAEIAVVPEKGIAYPPGKAPHILPAQQTVAHHNEHHCAYAEVHQVLHYNVACILGTGKARLHHCKARLHEEHQRRTYKVPDAECLIGHKL